MYMKRVYVANDNTYHPLLHLQMDETDRQAEKKIDKTLADSFPASDPPAWAAEREEDENLDLDNNDDSEDEEEKEKNNPKPPSRH